MSNEVITLKKRQTYEDLHTFDDISLSSKDDLGSYIARKFALRRSSFLACYLFLASFLLLL